MTPEEKEQISKKISFIIADALESNKVDIKIAGQIAQICIKYIDEADSFVEFKTVLQNEPDKKLSPFINEILRIFKE